MSQLLIAGINLNNSPKGGEHYKNQLLYDFLNVSISMKTLDTHHWKKKPIVLLKLFYYLILKGNWDKIIISITSKSALKVIKLVAKMKFANLNKVIFFVVGGNLPKLLNVKSLQLINSLDKVIVQGEKIKNELILLGVNTKIHVLPNFKRVEQVQIGKKNLRFVYLGTITRSKGVFDVIEALENLEITFHFYGPMDLNDEDQIIFKSKLTESIQYKGYLNILNNETEAYSILSEYTALVFPTYYPGEGFPGVFIDAFISGLPIITTNWNMNEEIVTHGFNGRIINVQDVQGLRDAILWYQNNFLQDEYLTHVKNAVASAQKYSYPKVLSDYYHAHWNS
jgi:glycosyltransferase involved in cell wall biosynthesis